MLESVALLSRRLRLSVGNLIRGGALPVGLNHWQTINLLHDQLHVSRPKGLRSSYTWSVLHCANIARRLGMPRVAAIEFGVAGGNGLCALERCAEWAERQLGVHVEVYGFDTGTGLPPPVDYRDTPFVHHAGDFPMDERQLKERLHHATLVLGLLSETLAEFVNSASAPIGFISFDLDYFSSTMDAFALLMAKPEMFMPRVMCYFDDVTGYPWGELNGERRAISEFNAANTSRNIARLQGLRHMVPRSQFNEAWPDAMYVAHILDHPRYNDDEGVAISRALDLEERP